MNLAVVGLGAMGQNHARVAKQLGILGAVVESCAEPGGRAAKALEVPLVPDLASLAAHVDSVIIATPTSTHTSLANQALDLGLHVLVEKPIAPTVQDATTLVDKAHDLGLTLAVGHVERHNPVVQWAKQTVATGNVGDLISTSARRLSSFPGRIRDVGCILDIGIHELDAALYLVGDKPTTVFAQGGSYKAGGFEDHAMIHIGFENGASSNVEVNWLTPRRIRQAMLTCTEGLVEFDYMAQTGTISRSEYAEGAGSADYNPAVEHDMRQFTMRRQEPLRLEIEDFVDAIQKKRRPLVDGIAGRSALAVAEAALESMRTNQAVHLEA